MPGDNNDFQADKKDSGGEGQPVEQRLEIQIREDQVQNAVTFLSHPKVGMFLSLNDERNDSH